MDTRKGGRRRKDTRGEKEGDEGERGKETGERRRKEKKKIVLNAL